MNYFVLKKSKQILHSEFCSLEPLTRYLFVTPQKDISFIAHSQVTDVVTSDGIVGIQRYKVEWEQSKRDVGPSLPYICNLITRRLWMSSLLCFFCKMAVNEHYLNGSPPTQAKRY